MRTGLYRRRLAAKAALNRKPKPGRGVFDLYRLEAEHAKAEARSSAPVVDPHRAERDRAEADLRAAWVLVVDADTAALEASAREIAKSMGDDLDGCG